jgi:hypothetical protein
MLSVFRTECHRRISKSNIFMCVFLKMLPIASLGGDRLLENNELELMWKEAVMALQKVQFDISLEKIWKVTKVLN